LALFLNSFDFSQAINLQSHGTIHQKVGNTLIARATDSKPKIPTGVKGFTIMENDHLLRSFKLNWKPNPPSEHVDSYAVYLLNIFFPDNGAELITTTSKSSIVLKSWDSDRERGKQPKGTISLVSDAGLIMSVVAHNKYGWGLVPKNAQAPDHSRTPIVPKNLLAKYSASIGSREWQCTQEIADYYSQPC